jgi:hypothetical protein
MFTTKKPGSRTSTRPLREFSDVIDDTEDINEFAKLLDQEKGSRDTMPDVYFGSPSAAKPDGDDWREDDDELEEDETEDDDEELDETPEDVIELLGFDPKEFDA